MQTIHPINRVFALTGLLLLSLFLSATPTRANDGDKDDPQAELRSFHVPDGFQVNLFASEAEGIVKPVTMRWDSLGRLWVSCIPSYPQPKPGELPDDRIIILEDTRHTGHVDRSTIFARGLMLPMGLELGDHGAYVTNGTDLAHLQNVGTDASFATQQPVLRGFFSGDSHQDINSFIWGPGGELMFCQGLHAFSRVETPWGVERLEKAGVWRYWPKTGQLDPFFGWDMGPQNPYGIVFDDWGQCLMTAGNGQGIYYMLPSMIRSRHFLDPRRIDETRNIKFCGVDIIGTQALPDEVQGLMVAPSILNNSVYWFKLDNDGSGFHAKDLPPLLTSTHSSFRGVDAKIGPDGAIYIADWYNPIIGHYQASLRHPDRDHAHGRIWRITARGRALVKQPELTKLSLPQLFEQFRSPERWTRYQTKRVLAEKEGKEVCDALGAWISHLSAKDTQLDHLLYESLGVYEMFERVEPALLSRMLSAKDYHVRAYAASVIGHWQDRLPDTLAMLQQAAADENPRVRLAAVVSASYVPSSQALEAALIAADQPMDRFLQDALTQAVAALKPYWRPAFDAGQLSLGNKPDRLAALCKADGSSDVLKSLLKLVQTESLGDESRSSALGLLAQIGGPADLASLLNQPAVANNPRLLSRALDEMASNYRRHGVALPARDQPSVLERLLSSTDAEVRRAAVTLTGLWRVEALRPRIEASARDAASPDALRRAADEALADFGSPAAPVLKELSTTGPLRSRSVAVAALSRIDLAAAAQLASHEFAEENAGSEAPILLAAFLSRDGGADALGGALAKLSISKDTARLSLRALSTAGGQSGTLWDVLSKAAGNAGTKLEYDAKLVKALADEAIRSGNPASGEHVFRSQVTNCLACHAIGGAGGRVGPDLAPVGTALPIDLVVESVLWPQRQIKEGYTATLVQTRDGEVTQGYRVSENPSEYVLREPATGRLIHIPSTKIKAKRDIGSLMPDGLTDGLTHKELVDLVRFLSELGKPGPYRVSTSPITRVWETMEATSSLTKPPPRTDPSQWTPRFSMTNGELPLDEFAGTAEMIWARTHVIVTKAGKFSIELADKDGIAVWSDSTTSERMDPASFELSAGVHAITLGVDLKARHSRGIICELRTFSGSSGDLRPTGIRTE